MSSTTNNTTDSLINFPWSDIIDITTNKSVVNKAASIPEETYVFAANSKNRKTLIQSALKSLQNTDPQNATSEKAESLADMMQIFAKMMVKELKAQRNQR